MNRRGGTSLAGNATGGGLVLDLSRCDRIHAIDPVTRTARVEPGVILDDLRRSGRGVGRALAVSVRWRWRATSCGGVGWWRSSSGGDPAVAQRQRDAAEQCDPDGRSGGWARGGCQRPVSLCG